LKLSGTHQLLVYACVIALGGRLHAMKNGTEAIVSSCWEGDWT